MQLQGHWNNCGRPEGRRSVALGACGISLGLLMISNVMLFPVFQGPDDNMTLKEAKFCIGDFLDVSINSPNSRMDRWARKSQINLISMWQVR